jgi:acyl-CoA-binding protein
MADGPMYGPPFAIIGSRQEKWGTIFDLRSSEDFLNWPQISGKQKQADYQDYVDLGQPLR